MSSSKTTYSSMPHLPGLLLLVSLTPWQATVNPRRCQRLLNTHRQFWLSVLWGHCSFLLGPGVHKVLFVPSKNLFPQSCGSSVIKSRSPSKSDSLGILSPFAGSPGWKVCCGPRTFTELLGYNFSSSLFHFFFSALIFPSTLGFLCCSFSSCYRYKVQLFI